MSPTELSKSAGISVPYASQILSDDPKQRRTPSRPLAIHIFRTTGWRHPSIEGLSDEQIAVLEEVDTWSPRAQEEAA